MPHLPPTAARPRPPPQPVNAPATSSSVISSFLPSFPTAEPPSFEYTFTDKELNELLGYMERQQSGLGSASLPGGSLQQAAPDPLPFFQTSASGTPLALQFQVGQRVEGVLPVCCLSAWAGGMPPDAASCPLASFVALGPEVWGSTAVPAVVGSWVGQEAGRLVLAADATRVCTFLCSKAGVHTWVPCHWPAAHPRWLHFACLPACLHPHCSHTRCRRPHQGAPARRRLRRGAVPTAGCCAQHPSRSRGRCRRQHPWEHRCRCR